MTKIVIGITEGRKYENYVKWISEISSIEIICLSHKNNNATKVMQCDGIILTGGEDVHPKFYNRNEYVNEYHLNDFNVARDEFELEVLTHAQKIPLLGICRGLQIANVFFGGTLIPDIASFGKPDHAKYEEGKDRYHSIEVVKNTLLQKISRTHGEINSAHHQAVDKVGNGLIINSFSKDGTIEGLEYADKSTRSFLLLVQWHPERMVDDQSVFSKGIRDCFVEAITNG